jgi:hypothetical protein
MSKHASKFQLLREVFSIASGLSLVAGWILFLCLRDVVLFTGLAETSLILIIAAEAYAID